MSLRTKHGALLALAACAMAAACPAGAWAAPNGPCPVSYSRLSMPYKHERGTSTPTVELAFTNQTGKKIVRAKFGLIVIGSDGSQVPYEQALTFSAGAEPGKAVTGEWDLDMEKVDMHRKGETIYLKSARFDDNTSWQDDGNERCRDDVYYGPR